MIQLVVFINLFFVPVLPLYMIYRKRRKPLLLNPDLLFQYCIITACNIPLTKVFTFLAKKVGGMFISIDSGYYTVAALVSSALLYILYLYRGSKLLKSHWAMLCKGWNKLYTYCNLQHAYYMTYFKKKYWKEKVGNRGAKRILGDLAPAYFLVFASCFMMLIFEPILLYATNMDDFWFDFKIMIWPVLGLFACFLLGGIIIVSAIYFLNIFFSGRGILYKLLTLVGFIMFFLLYLQGNWLAGNLPPLTGEEIIWENYGASENRILMSATVILSVAAVISILRLKLRRTVRYAAAGAGIVSIMMTVSLVPTVVKNEALKSKDTFVATVENFNSVSLNKNFLVFLVDSVDSRTFNDVLIQDEDFSGIMDDFTYYPDTLSTYPLTKNSIPNILTGAVNYNETGFLEYSSMAYNRSPLFKKLKQNKYGINLYSPMISWAGQRNFEIENSTSIYDVNVNFMNFMEQELKYIRFKYFPYGLKQWSEIETLDFNTCREDISGQSGYSWTNWSVYDYLRWNKVLDKRSENYFQFIHCEGGHLPLNMDKYLNSVENGTYEQKIAASLTIIKTYLQKLKDNDAYDNSIIVIMADHGYQSGDSGEHLNLTPVRCNPILFIKGVNERHELIESDRPVSYMDLQDAFCELIDGKQSTELFKELQSGRTRTVIWHEWVDEAHMVEYSTTGKAWEIEKFTPTGNVYDLKE